jgi:hypothetical protein
MQRRHALSRRTGAWIVGVSLVVGTVVTTALVSAPPSVARNRTILVPAKGDSSVFGRFPRRNFGMRTRLVVGAEGGSRAYLRFDVPKVDLTIDDATLVLHTIGDAAEIAVHATGRFRERYVTNKSAPAVGATIGAIPRTATRGSVALDLTPLLRATPTTVRLVLTTHGHRTVFASRQSSTGKPTIKIHGHVKDASTTPSPTDTATPSPTGSSTSTPSATPTGDVQPSFPIRAAFYYPWFPETWGSASNPFTNYHPSLGLYDSSDASVIAAHIRAMQYGGIQAGIASWWGQGTKTDSRVPNLLSGADGTDFRWTLYYEQEAQGDPTVAQIRNDLEYIDNHYGNDPSYLRIDGRFVVFVYADGSDACGMASRWAQANTVNAYVVLKVFSGYKSCADQPDGWHQYGPASATSDMSPYSYTISPGFWKKGESSPRLTRDPSRWQNQVAAMTASGARFQLITTFNEWGEGTAVESASEWKTSSGYGTYLDILHGLSASTGPSPSPTSTTSSPSPSPTSTGSGSSGSAPLVVIYMENKERSSVVGSSSAPYQNALLGKGINLTHYYGVAHPSLPNYLALGNGQTDGKQGTDSIKAGELTQSPTLWNQLQKAGVSWAVYEEDMPSACYGGTTYNLYALKHNPATPFASVYQDAATCSHVLPFTKLDPTNLPQVSFVAPNLCNDEHDCPLSTGDSWLQSNVEPMLKAGATVVLTYDEGSSGAGVNGTSGGGNIYAVVVGKGIAAETDTGQYNHYSLLASIEARFGLTKLNNAATATELPLG